jgi:hypothetical protein
VNLRNLWISLLHRSAAIREIRGSLLTPSFSAVSAGISLKQQCHPWSFRPLESLFSCVSWFPEPLARLRPLGPIPYSEFRTPHSLIIPREQSLREEQSDENDPLLRFLGHFVSRKRAFFPENARTTVQAPRRLRLKSIASR